MSAKGRDRTVAKGWEADIVLRVGWKQHLPMNRYLDPQRKQKPLYDGKQRLWLMVALRVVQLGPFVIALGYFTWKAMIDRQPGLGPTLLVLSAFVAVTSLYLWREIRKPG